jgi:hypothetical protein
MSRVHIGKDLNKIKEAAVNVLHPVPMHVQHPSHVQQKTYDEYQKEQEKLNAELALRNNDIHLKK